mmetsp:Transcript_19617/g.45872  ORF Transcript_19617/g.45872 Transcript_19617/m.45872 type:complete len:294 (-) Transcript_19617:204-1085(-)
MLRHTSTSTLLLLVLASSHAWAWTSRASQAFSSSTTTSKRHGNSSERRIHAASITKSKKRVTIPRWSMEEPSFYDSQMETEQRLQKRILMDQAQQQIEASELARKETFPTSTAQSTNDDIIEAGLGGNIVVTKTDAGTLVIDLPSPGLDANSVMSGAFSVAWFSVVVPATFSAGLFMLPFWAAGAAVAKSAVIDPFVDTRLQIGQFAWCLNRAIAGKTRTLREGATSELGGAQLDVETIVTSESGQGGRPVYKIKLLGTRKETSFMVPSATVDELQSLCDQINTHLQFLRQKD